MGVPLERIGRTSPTRVGSEVPRLNLHVQSREAKSWARLLPWGWIWQSVGAAACGGSSRPGGAAADVETRERARLVRATLALRGGDGSVRKRASLCPRARWARSHAAHHSGGIRSSVSVIGNDANDAAAICAALRQPQMRFVTIKSAEQQACLSVHRLRQRLQEERTAALNRLRGLLAEFGRVYANSAAAALAGARAALADETLPATLRQCMARQLTHLGELEAHLAECDREVARDAQADARAQRVARLSGVGLLTASAVAATVVDPQQFRCGRQFAAWLGLTPRQHSIGGKTRLGRITRRGDAYLCARCSCRARARRCRRRCGRLPPDERGWPPGSSPPTHASAITKCWWRSPTSTPD